MKYNKKYRKRNNFFETIQDKEMNDYDKYIIDSNKYVDSINNRIEIQSMLPAPGFDLYCPPKEIRTQYFNVYDTRPSSFFLIDNELLLQQQLNSIFNIPNISLFDVGYIHGFSYMDEFDNIRMNRNPNAYYRVTHPELNIYDINLKPLYKFNTHIYSNITKELSDHIICNSQEQIRKGNIIGSKLAYRFRYVFSPGEQVSIEMIQRMLILLAKYYLKNFIIYARVLPGDIDTFMPTIHFIVSDAAYRKYKNSNMILSKNLGSKILDINYGLNIIKSGEDINPDKDISWGYFK